MQFVIGKSRSLLHLVSILLMVTDCKLFTVWKNELPVSCKYIYSIYTITVKQVFYPSFLFCHLIYNCIQYRKVLYWSAMIKIFTSKPKDARKSMTCSNHQQYS